MGASTPISWAEWVTWTLAGIASGMALGYVAYYAGLAVTAIQTAFRIGSDGN